MVGELSSSLNNWMIFPSLPMDYMKTMFLSPLGTKTSGGESYGYRWWGTGSDFSTLHWVQDIESIL